MSGDLKRILLVVAGIVVGSICMLAAVDVAGVDIEHVADHYFPLLSGLGALASAITALWIATENWRRSREPEVMVRPKDKARGFACGFENLGGQPVRITDARISVVDADVEIETEWGAIPVLLLPDEWYPGPQFSGEAEEAFREIDADKVEVWFRYEPLKGGEATTESFVFDANSRVSNPRTKKREVAFHKYDELVMDVRRKLERDESD